MILGLHEVIKFFVPDGFACLGCCGNGVEQMLVREAALIHKGKVRRTKIILARDLTLNGRCRFVAVLICYLGKRFP